MILPNVFIPGSQKSGTTALASWLDLHPDIAVSSIKEPTIFSAPDYPASIVRFDGLFAGAEDCAIKIDASTSYMVDEKAPARILDTCGRDLRFIFIVREPAGRAYSAYTYLRARGHDRRAIENVFLSLPTDIDAAIAQERAQVEAAFAAGLLDTGIYAPRYHDPLWPFCYVANSAYERQWARYAEIWGADRCHVIDFDDFQRDQRGQANLCATFLGLAPVITDMPGEGARNVTMEPRSQGMVETARGLRRAAAAVVPQALLERVAKPLRKMALKRPEPVDPRIFGHLRSILAGQRARIAA
jgi:Sulfotransferase domain